MRIRFQFLILPVLFVAFTSSLQAEATPLGGVRADRIAILKSKRQLQLWEHGKLIKTYKVALGPNALGRKEQEGDGRTPEGLYKVVAHNPRSEFHLSLRLSYPSADDRARAAKLGVSPGGDIMIHGLPAGYAWVGAAHTQHDWTAGCIAVTNPEIKEIYRAVVDGTEVEIRP
jgi:murein L,D-transpeptidase YafK